MDQLFYHAFDDVAYPCYWLGRDGAFWANGYAYTIENAAARPQSVHAFLAALMEEKENMGLEANTSQSLWLHNALRLRGIEVLPHRDGFFAAWNAQEQLPISAFSCGLREPVSDMLSALQTLARRLDNCHLEESDEIFCNECLESIQKNEYYLLRLANNMELYNMEKSAQKSLKSVEMSSFVEGLCKKAKNTFAKQGIAFETELDPEVLPVRAAGRVLGHLIVNILRNSIYFTRDGNKVKVTLKKLGGRVVLTIKDRGLGIRPEALPHVFTPYYSAYPNLDSEERPGLGLGLALVQSAVRALSGTVALESTFGEGTSVTVALPLAETEEVQLGSETVDYSDYFNESQSPVYIQLCGYCPLPVM